jgi:hypothetical protein
MEVDQRLSSQENHKVKTVFACKVSLGTYSYQFECLTHSIGTDVKRYDLFVKKTGQEAKIVGGTQAVFTIGFFLLRHYKRIKLGYIKRKQIIEKVS